MPCLGGTPRHLQGSLILVGIILALSTSEIDARRLILRKKFYEKIQVQNSIFRPFSCASKLLEQKGALPTVAFLALFFFCQDVALTRLSFPLGNGF